MSKCPAPWCGHELGPGEEHPAHATFAKEIADGTAWFVVVTLEDGSQNILRVESKRNVKVHGYRG